MRLITAITLFSATVMATNHGQWEQQNGYGQYGNQYSKEGWGQPAPEPTPHPVEQAPPPAYNHESPPAQTYAPPPAHEMPSQPPSHEAPPAHQMPPAAETTPAPKPEHSMVVEQPPAGEAKKHTVTVGGEGLVYTPQVVYAEPGDTVHFIFMKQNHSVTQSTFAKPCNKMDGGEDSGLLPNPNNTVVPAPTWEYVVKDKEPTWWYCKQRTGSHCGKGMVFAINPTKEKTFDKFREVAIQINGTATSTAAPEATPPPEQPSSTVTLINEPTGTPAPEKPKEEPSKDVQPPKDAPYTAPGWNEGGPGSCNCACFCGVGSFPQGDGVGAYGGFGGSMAAPW